jgi:hypothetical protein
MFKQASERIIELISDVLKKMKESNLKMIVLVGGFSIFLHLFFPFTTTHRPGSWMSGLNFLLALRP